MEPSDVNAVGHSAQPLIQDFEMTQDGDISNRIVQRGNVTKVDMPTQQYGTAEDSQYPGDDHATGDDQSKHNKIMYSRISPSNRFWLRFYLVVNNLGVVLLVIAYTFYIMGLFQPILYVDAGELTDTDLFQPFYETLPHSLITLYQQKAYFTVAIAGLFSITLPFVKMIVTALAYITAMNHRRTQLRLFFGSKPIDKSGIRNEDDGNIKYAREMLIILKLVSKFQMVDVIILLMNTVFLRCVFIWARPGQGLLYLIIYCVLSIAGAQMVNFAVEGEKDIFESWYAIKYAIVPPEFSTPSSSTGNDEEDGKVDVDGFSNNKRWYTSEDFICLMAGVNILSCISLMTNEKLLSVNFTVDSRKVLAIDSTTMSYSEFIMNLHGLDYHRISIMILFFLCIMFPMAFSLLFIASIFGYNFCKRNRTHPIKNVEIAESDDEPNLDYNWDVKITCFVFKVCNIVSEWSCGEVVSLGTMAAYTSMATAERVKVGIPPKNTCSALFMMGAFGISSFLLMAIFYIWNQNVKREFSHMRIYVKYLESPNPGRMAKLMSANNLKVKDSSSDEKPPERMVERITEAITEAEEKRAQRRRFFVPYLEGVRSVLYSKWVAGMFFGILTAITVLFTMSAYTYSYPPPYVSPKAVNRYLQNDLHEVFNLTMKKLPDSIGLCDDPVKAASQPCRGDQPLFELKSSIYLGVVWISGIKSISLLDAQYTLLPDNRMAMKVKIHVEEIRALIRVAATRDEGLENLLQQVIKTGGDGFTAEVQISAHCTNRKPQMRDIRVDSIHMEDFSIHGEWASLLDDVAEPGKAIGSIVASKLNNLLRDPRQQIIWRGISFDIVEMINLIVANNWPTTFVCPVAKKSD
ncbi:hypothetical protein BgAZ_200740 [Babesia gibsoni]|uniref:Uncharacterized protein n=1 Tax=Babesia gibsoni TaxID=33632 RepID=A0AAD8LPB6_BABGI|nr:hypothetical protein BgAZ_200740 [Babesia gibsoni]